MKAIILFEDEETSTNIEVFDIIREQNKFRIKATGLNHLEYLPTFREKQRIITLVNLLVLRWLQRIHEDHVVLCLGYDKDSDYYEYDILFKNIEQ